MTYQQAVRDVMEIADKLNQKLWQAFNTGDTDDEITAIFKKRYHRLPDKIQRTGGCTLAGPITKEEHEAKCKPSLT